MLRDHKNKIEEIMELNTSMIKRKNIDSNNFTQKNVESLRLNESIDTSYLKVMYNALETLSKDTLDYIQTLYYVGAEIELNGEKEYSKDEVFQEYLKHVKSFKEDRNGQIMYLTNKMHLSKFIDKGINYLGWDVDNI